MGMVAAVGRDELDDGAGVVRAVLEDGPLKDLGPVPQDQRRQQLIDEGLGDLDAREVEHDLAVLPQRLFHLRPHGRRGAREPARRPFAWAFNIRCARWARVSMAASCRGSGTEINDAYSAGRGMRSTSKRVDGGAWM